MLIGRKEETRKLLKAHASEYSQFVTIYGRRRVGKTFFVREAFKYKFTFEHTGMNKTGMAGQLESWAVSMRNCGYYVNTPKNWIMAFEQLMNLIIASKDRKKVVFIDEMPWMDTPKSGFLSALEHFWNGWASARKDITLIVCGSATSWIMNKLIRNKGGLRGRVTTRIRIKPFTLAECEKYNSANKLGLSKKQIAECAMIMGGIPYYWSFLDREKSLAQNIDYLFFNEDGELHGEFDELYSSIFKKPEAYINVITKLGTKKVGMTREELTSLGIQENGKLTKVLKDLEECGFIRKYNSYGYAKKNAIFQLIDPFTLFHFKFMEDNKLGDERFWSHSQSSPVYHNWCGLAFERLCFAHINQIKQALGITGVISGICSWQVRTTDDRKGAQIDLLIDRGDNVIDICEMKFTKDPFYISADYEETLQGKRSRFIEETGTDKAVHLVMVSSAGVVMNAYAGELQKIITLDDLFAEYSEI